MCADQFVFRQSFIDAFCTTVVCASDWLVNLAQFTEFLQIEIHSLVGDSWQRVSSEIDFGILVEYCSGIFIEFDGDGVGGLDCCEGYGIAGDIGSLKKTAQKQVVFLDWEELMRAIFSAISFSSKHCDRLIVFRCM